MCVCIYTTEKKHKLLDWKLGVFCDYIFDRVKAAVNWEKKLYFLWDMCMYYDVFSWFVNYITYNAILQAASSFLYIISQFLMWYYSWHDHVQEFYWFTGSLVILSKRDSLGFPNNSMIKFNWFMSIFCIQCFQGSVQCQVVGVFKMANIIFITRVKRNGIIYLKVISFFGIVRFVILYWLCF